MVRMSRTPLLIGGFGLLALLLLPPRPYPEPAHQDGTVRQLWNVLLLGEGYYYLLGSGGAMRDRLDRVGAGIMRRVRAADIADLVHAEADRRGIRSASGRITLLLDESLSAVETQALLASMEEEVDRLPASTHEGAPITVTIGARNEAGALRQAERLAPREDGRSGCHVLVHTGLAGVPRTSSGELDGPALLGACALYGRYGMPGSAGVRLGAERMWWNDRPSDLVAEAARGGVSRLLYDAWQADGCRRGVTAHCLLLVETSDGPAGQENNYSAALQLRQDIGFYLLATHGGEAFGRMWRSNLPPAEAAAAAFGSDLPSLVHDYTLQWVSERQYGPRFKATAGLTTVGWILVLGLLASAAIARRRGG